MSRRQGMTLMELVVAIALTGMMAAAGAATFASIIDHRRVIRESTVETERAAAMREMVRTWVVSSSIGPRELTRGLGAAAPARGGATSAMNTAAVSAAQASGDELSFTTSALNPSLVANVRIRLYVDADDNTPEHGLTMEYQANLQQPIARRMLDSTIDTLKVEFLDSRTNRWLRASEAATITNPVAVRVTLLPGTGHSVPPILELPMIFQLVQNRQRVFLN